MKALRKARIDGIREEARKKRLSGGAVLELYGFVELPAEEPSSKADAPKKPAPAAPRRRSVLARATADKAGKSGTSNTEKKEAPKRKILEVTVAERPPFRVVEEAAPEEGGLTRTKRARGPAPIPDAVPVADKEAAKVAEPTFEGVPVAPDSAPPIVEVQGESSVRETEGIDEGLEDLRQIILSPARVPLPARDAPAPMSETVADTEVAMALGRQAFLPRDERDLVGRPMEQLQRLFTGSVFRVRVTPHRVTCTFIIFC
jgi:hypothetical protein